MLFKIVANTPLTREWGKEIFCGIQKSTLSLFYCQVSDHIVIGTLDTFVYFYGQKKLTEYCYICK